MKETKNKILFVSGSLDRGGAQRVLTLLADEYAARGWEVHIITLLNDEVGYPINSSIILHSLAYKGSYLTHTLSWILGIRKWITALNPKVILSFAGRINILTMLAGSGLNLPIIISERNDPAHDRRNRWEVTLCKRFYAKAALVVLQTEYQRLFYQAYCSHNSVVIGNPISAPSYSGVHHSKDVISVGKLMQQKNHPMLIQAFAQLAQAYPHKKVHIFGDGALKGELQSLIDAAGISEQVILEGNDPNIFAAMQTHQYFVMTSDYEGLSNALLEAMTMGMICISTKWNGVEEVLQDGVNGFLVPIGDSTALADKLTYVFTHDCSAVSQAAIETGKSFRKELVAAQWMNAVQKTIEGTT